MKPIQLEYFDLHGRALQLRAISWYCMVPIINKRTIPPPSIADFKSIRILAGQ